MNLMYENNCFPQIEISYVVFENKHFILNEFDKTRFE